MNEDQNIERATALLEGINPCAIPTAACARFIRNGNVYQKEAWEALVKRHVNVTTFEEVREDWQRNLIADIFRLMSEGTNFFIEIDLDDPDASWAEVPIDRYDEEVRGWIKLLKEEQNSNASETTTPADSTVVDSASNNNNNNNNGSNNSDLLSTMDKLEAMLMTTESDEADRSQMTMKEAFAKAREQILTLQQDDTDKGDQIRTLQHENVEKRAQIRTLQHENVEKRLQIFSLEDELYQANDQNQDRQQQSYLLDRAQ